MNVFFASCFELHTSESTLLWLSMESGISESMTAGRAAAMTPLSSLLPLLPLLMTSLEPSLTSEEAEGEEEVRTEIPLTVTEGGGTTGGGAVGLERKEVEKPILEGSTICLCTISACSYSVNWREGLVGFSVWEWVVVGRRRMRGRSD